MLGFCTVQWATGDVKTLSFWTNSVNSNVFWCSKLHLNVQTSNFSKSRMKDTQNQSGIIRYSRLKFCSGIQTFIRLYFFVFTENLIFFHPNPNRHFIWLEKNGKSVVATFIRLTFSRFSSIFFYSNKSFPDKSDV